MNEASAVLSLPAIQRAVVALLITGTTMPVVGVFIIGLDIITARFAMMHVALLGVGLGLIIGLDPMACAVALCALTGGALAPLLGRRNSLSGPMGLVMTVAIALALLSLSLSGVNATGAFQWLWGSLLATRNQDLAFVALLGVAIAGFYLWRRKQLALLLFDAELAAASGIDVRLLAALILIVVAISIASALPLTGALLVDAVTLLPALAARNIASSLNSMVKLAVAFGLLGNATGFILSILLDQPPGPVLVIASGLFTMCTFIFGRAK